MVRFLDMIAEVDRIDDMTLPALDRDVRKLSDSVGLGPDPTGSTVLMVAMFDVLRCDEDSNVLRTANSGHNAPAGLTVNGNFVVMGNVANTEGALEADKTLAGAFNTFRVAAPKVMIDLATAYKVGKLSEVHIDSYFKSKGNLAVISERMMKVVKKISPFLPNLVNIADFKNHLSDNEWMKYRMTYSSSASLCHKAMEIVHETFPGLFTNVERTAVDNSLASPESKILNNAIPTITLAKAYVILESESVLPTDWRQGKKAVDSIPSRNLKSIRSVMAAHKRITSVETTTENIDNLNDLALSGIALGVFAGATEDDVGEARRRLTGVLKLPKVSRNELVGHNRRQRSQDDHAINRVDFIADSTLKLVAIIAIIVISFAIVYKIITF